MRKISTVSLIGSGRVATILAKALKERDVVINDVYSRQLKNAKTLAKEVNARATASLSILSKNSDLYIIAVKDDVITKVVNDLAQYLPETAFVVHTSGATAATVLKVFPNHGIFYPLQSFSPARQLNFSQVPFCLSATNENLFIQLENLVKQLGAPTYRIDDQQRAYLHVAAVFVNNFTNYCYHIAHQITAHQDIPFELLQPLILETALKLQDGTPQELQTGPAIRNDQKTMQRHLALLPQEDWKYLYELISQSIQKMDSK
ncbi:MAG: DUF2520 domain-containing protein [Bacteroidota bacterium]